MRSDKPLLVAWIAVSVLVVTPIRARAQEPEAIRTDRQFALEAASGGKMMVALGRKAQQLGLDPGVSRYARRVVHEHRGAMDVLRMAARGKGIPLSTTMTDEHQGAINRLSRLRGSPFDRAYVKQQVEAHRKAVGLFEEEIAKGRDPEFRAFAGWMLPTLRDHLRTASELEVMLTGGEAGGMP